MLFFTTNNAACSIVHRFTGKILDEGSGHGQRAWAALRDKFDGCSREALRPENAKMNSARMSPCQGLDEFLYELDNRRELLNACDSPKGPTDRQFEDIIVQALPPEYERIRTSHLEKLDFRITDICRTMSANYAANLARSSSTTGITERGAALPAAEDNRRDIICLYCKRAGHFQNTCSLCAKHEQQRQQREQRNEQQNQQQGGRRQRGQQVEVKHYASRQVTEGEGVRITTLLTTATPTAAP